MIRKQIYNRLREMCTHILFNYNEKPCGLDPLAINQIEMWYDKEYYIADSADTAMNYPLFGGKSLNEICDKITDLEL